MKRFSKGWYRLEAYAVVGRNMSANDARIITTKSGVRKAETTLQNKGYGLDIRNYPMGQIKELSGTQAQSVNTFKIEQF